MYILDTFWSKEGRKEMFLIVDNVINQQKNLQIQALIAAEVLLNLFRQVFFTCFTWYQQKTTLETDSGWVSSQIHTHSVFYCDFAGQFLCLKPYWIFKYVCVREKKKNWDKKERK